MKIVLACVDPQNDFCIVDDGAGNKGKLAIPGASEDIQRIAQMTLDHGHKLEDIFVTLDSHQTFGIERPRWWVSVATGKHPDPFTILGIHPDGRRIVKYNLDDSYTEEEFTTYLPGFLHNGGPVVDPNDPTGQKRLGSFGYIKEVGRHWVWTEHCVVGTWGWSVVPVLADALRHWEWNGPARVQYLPKGNNPWTEHYSAIKAKVPDPSDPSTQINTRFVSSLEEADVILVTGQAKSHCVADTFRDVADSFTDPRYIAKLVLLTDASSSVPGCEAMGEAFEKEMVARGARAMTIAEFWR